MKFRFSFESVIYITVRYMPIGWLQEKDVNDCMRLLFFVVLWFILRIWYIVTLPFTILSCIDFEW